MKKAIPVLALMLSVAISGATQPEKPASNKAAASDRDADPLPVGVIAQLGSTRFRHGDSVAYVGYALGGKVVASIGRNPGLALWDAKTGKLLHKFSFPENAFTGIFGISPDGKKLVTGRRLVDIVTGKEIREFKAPDVFFARSAFSADGAMVAIGSRQKLAVYDAGTGEMVRSIDDSKAYINSVAFSPKDPKVLASAHDDKTVRLWDATTGKLIHQLEGHGAPAGAVAFAPDGKTLASSGRDGVIRIWTVATGKLIRQAPADNAIVRSLVFSPNGKLLACTGSGGTIGLWNPKTLAKIRHWEAHALNCDSIAFEPKGKVLAAAGPHSIRFWDIETGKEINPAPGHPTHIISLKYRADGKVLRSCGMDGVVVDWDVGSPGKIARRFGTPDAPARTEFWLTKDVATEGLRLAQSMTNFIGFKGDPAIRLKDLLGGKEVQLESATKGAIAFGAAVVFAPDGKTLATTSNDGVRLWDSVSGKQGRHLFAKVGISRIGFSPDGKVLAIAGFDRRIRLCNVATGKEVQSWDFGNELLNSLLFSPDGNLLAAADRRGVRIWSAETGAAIKQFTGKLQFSTIAFSPTGRVLAASGAGPGPFGTDEYYQGGIQFWEVATGEPIRRFDTAQGNRNANFLAFAPDGRSLAADSSGTILLYNLTGQDDGKPAVLATADLDRLWKDLDEDAAKADRAHWRLALAPTQSVPFLKERLRPATSADATLLKMLIAELDSPMFEKRKKADLALIELGESAEAALQKSLGTNLTVEHRRRVEQILSKRDHVMRRLRALATLEQIGNPEARRVLESVAKETPNPRIAQAADAALRRMKRGSP